MSTSPTTVHTIDHPSRPVWFSEPYLITRDAKDSYLWHCIPSEEPVLHGKLEGKISAHAEHHVVSKNHLLTATKLQKDDQRWDELLVHNLESGSLVDQLSLALSESSESRYEAGFLGVDNRTAAVYKKSDEERRIEVYTISEEGKLTLEEALSEPSHIPDQSRMNIHHSGYPSSTLIRYAPTGLVEAANYTVFPSGVQLTAWSSNPRHTQHETVDFVRVLDAQADRESHLLGHILIPPLNTFVLASYEHALEQPDPQPATILRSFDSDTLSLKWTTTVPQKTSTLHFLPTRNVILAVGLSWSIDADSSGGVAETTIAVIDAASGAVQGTHAVKSPQTKCANLGISVGDASVTPSGDQVIVVFGDGQITVTSIDDFLDNGFKTATNAEGRFITHPFPETSLSTPKNKKEHKELDQGYWAWVNKAFYGDRQVILRAGRGMKEPTGFAVVSWK
ncbi:unnamed protein product [Cyclocybe aegerita]|uniref:Uncharacterized protein n=1 Tax=Cyclocybe aegerita TaxID=1973307 RepID=A0A8S0VV16_CYCAE|nr:unnamed protein product [Cyclocybe aegerita]